MKTHILILLASVAALAAAAAPKYNDAERIAAAEKRTEALTFTRDGLTLPYRQFFAPPRTDGARVPLILFLHGASRRGTDNRLPLSQCIPELLDAAPKHGGALVVAPQCPKEQRWSGCATTNAVFEMPAEMTPYGRLALELAREKAKDPRVDTNRVYITGLSMGGHGTWELIARAPDFFAAAVPICGGGDPRNAPKLQDLPIWAFHATDDASVLVCRQRAMVAALWALGGAKVSFTETPTGGHAVWRRVYKNPALWSWLFSQHR